MLLRPKAAWPQPRGKGYGRQLVQSLLHRPVEGEILFVLRYQYRHLFQFGVQETLVLSGRHHRISAGESHGFL